MINEWCPHCESEIELKGVKEPQKCPNCGKWILPCSLCDTDKVKCSECKLMEYRDYFEWCELHNRNIKDAKALSEFLGSR